MGVARGGACTPCAGPSAGVAPLRIERSVPACPKSGGFVDTGGGINASSGMSGSCGVGCGYPSVLELFRSIGEKFGWHSGGGYDV